MAKSYTGMNKSLSISNQIYIPLIASMLFGFIVVIVMSYLGIDEIKNNVYTSTAEPMRVYVDKSNKAKKSITMVGAILIAKNPKIIEALESDDKAQALSAIKETTDYFKNHTKFKNVKVHIRTKDVKSFLRS